MSIWHFFVPGHDTAITVTPAEDMGALTTSRIYRPRVASKYLRQLSDFVVPKTQVQLIETIGQGNTDQVRIVDFNVLLVYCAHRWIWNSLSRPSLDRVWAGRNAQACSRQNAQRYWKLKVYRIAEVLQSWFCFYRVDVAISCMYSLK